MNSDTTLLVFDIDDTLYPASSGFSIHRNGEVAVRFMVEFLGFDNAETARALREEYFEKYHSTFKSLFEASKEGKLPSGFSFETEQEQNMLGEYWANNAKYDLIKKVNFLSELNQVFERIAKLEEVDIIAFTNGPRKYGLQVLKELGLDKFFPEEKVFAVDDMKPHCKPEPEAFNLVFDKLKALTGKSYSLQTSVMIEDSVKNVKSAKNLGMRTILIDEQKQHTGLKEADLILGSILELKL